MGLGVYINTHEKDNNDIKLNNLFESHDPLDDSPLNPSHSFTYDSFGDRSTPLLESITI